MKYQRLHEIACTYPDSLPMQLRPSLWLRFKRENWVIPQNPGRSISSETYQTLVQYDGLHKISSLLGGQTASRLAFFGIQLYYWLIQKINCYLILWYFRLSWRCMSTEIRLGDQLGVMHVAELTKRNSCTSYKLTVGLVSFSGLNCFSWISLVCLQLCW